MDRAGRLLAILQLLRERRGPVVADEIASRFRLSRRTIYRDIHTLIAQGAPIEGVAGMGFVLGHGYFLPPLALDPDEANSIALGLRFVMRRGDVDLKRAARSALAKLDAVMPAGVAAAARNNGLVVAPPTLSTDDRLTAVRHALGEERKLRISYRSNGGTLTERTIWPVALGFFDETEIVAAWCQTRSAFRSFRLDRIISVETLDERFPRRRAILFAEWRAIEDVVET